MKAWIILWAVALCVAQPTKQALAADGVGVRRIAAPSKERGADLDVTVWYPAQPGGEPVMLGGGMFFTGTSARRDAAIAPGKFPLVLLSHGAGLAGSAQALSWIAAPLAERGFVVAAPTHPGNSGANRSAAETMKLWLRPADISDSLDAVAREPFFKDHLNAGEIGVLGLSMGGNTALALAGARIDPKRLAAYCDTDRLNPSLCGWIRESGVDLHALDLRSAGRDGRDRRIRFAMAIDPAPVDVFDSESFSSVDIPVALLNLGPAANIPLTAQAAGIAKAIPVTTYETIADASHYSMFALCRPGAAESAEAQKVGDPICSDGGGRSRQAIHAELIERAATAFSRALRTGP
ncbi:dienelactone hydrolase [Labrys okinawensis]|uniref:Dienelactone hydrolase n=1 Tax=Labrys okinawensis TaxID=346911 RepID=A0A2S9QHU7_9HYPH|nr:alpha/beta fold hydrolase [Labrys okinawensis]PRH88913.1 dienelactone hydrolase [Labrys okinawensis]